MSSEEEKNTEALQTLSSFKESFNRHFGKTSGSTVGNGGSDGLGNVPRIHDSDTPIKEHIRDSAVSEDGSCIALCGAIAESGTWKAGAAYQGLMILGGKPEDFCPECSRLWLKEQNGGNL